MGCCYLAHSSQAEGGWLCLQCADTTSASNWQADERARKDISCHACSCLHHASAECKVQPMALWVLGYWVWRWCLVLDKLLRSGRGGGAHRWVPGASDRSWWYLYRVQSCLFDRKHVERVQKSELPPRISRKEKLLLHGLSTWYPRTLSEMPATATAFGGEHGDISPRLLLYCAAHTTAADAPAPGYDACCSRCKASLGGVHSRRCQSLVRLGHGAPWNASWSGSAVPSVMGNSLSGVVCHQL